MKNGNTTNSQKRVRLKITEAILRMIWDLIGKEATTEEGRLQEKEGKVEDEEEGHLRALLIHRDQDHLTADHHLPHLIHRLHPEVRLR